MSEGRKARTCIHKQNPTAIRNIHSLAFHGVLIFERLLHTGKSLESLMYHLHSDKDGADSSILEDSTLWHQAVNAAQIRENVRHQ